MMNVVAICLVVTSLAAAGVFSPGPEKQSSDRKNDDVILKEGHRVVVVEYDQDGHANTKVSISPGHDHVPIKPASVSNLEGDLYQGAKDVLERSKDKVKEAAPSVAPEQKEDSGGHGNNGAKELICDAFGKCKHRIASGLEKAKEEVTEKVHEVEEDARRAKDAAEENLRRAGEAVARKAHEAREMARETFESTRGAVLTAKEEGQAMVEDVRRNLSQAAGAAKEVASGAGSRLRRLEGMARRHVASRLDGRTSAGLVHLLGFATAYGTCAWVTFVSGYVLAAALPRQQLGMVQSKMSPVYWRAMFSSIALSLAGHLLGQGRHAFAGEPEMLQGLNLLASLPLVLANMLYLEPRATKIMFERMKLEKEEGGGREHQGGAEAARATEPRPVPPDEAAAPAREDGEGGALRSQAARLNERLRKLNSYSSLLNVATLMALTWHLVYLAQRISAPC